LLYLPLVIYDTVSQTKKVNPQNITVDGIQLGTWRQFLKSLLLGISVGYFHDLPNIPLKITFNLS